MVAATWFTLLRKYLFSECSDRVFVVLPLTWDMVYVTWEPFML